eukprot:ANDGO_06163.mRNA.1 hypothetical protein
MSAGAAGAAGTSDQKVRIEDESLVFFERELQELEERVTKGALKAFGTSEHALLREVDVLLQNAANVAELCIALEMEHPTANIEDDKDFRAMRGNAFEEIKRRFLQKEEKMGSLHQGLLKVGKSVSELHTWTREPVG